MCWSLWGLIICSQKTHSSLAGLLETQSANNVLLKDRSHSVACLCGFFHPTDNDLYVFEGRVRPKAPVGAWLASRARTSASVLFLVPSSQSFRGMLRQVPERLSQTRDERRISAAGWKALAELHYCCSAAFTGRARLHFQGRCSLDGAVIKSIATNMIPSDLRNNSRAEMQACFWMIYKRTLRSTRLVLQ